MSTPTDLHGPLATKPGNDLHTVEAGVIVPILQAMLTAFVIAFAVMVLFAMGATLRPWAFRAGAGTFVICLAWSWIGRQNHWLSLTSVIQKVEELTGQDINRDGVIGAPAPADDQERRVRVDFVRSPNHTTIWHPNASDDQLHVLALGVLTGRRPLTEREWTGPGKPFSQAEWDQLRVDMLERNLLKPANPRNPRNGFILTDQGRRLLQEFLTPSPTEEWA